MAVISNLLLAMYLVIIIIDHEDGKWAPVLLDTIIKYN